MKSLREQLFGPAKSIRDKLSEAINGSYEVQKTGGNTQTVINKPNIVERLKGEKTTTTTDYIPKDNTIPKAEPITIDINKVETKPSTDIANPRKENLFNKARAGVENLFDGNKQTAEEQTEPIDNFQEESIENPPIDNTQVDSTELFRKGIVHNENRGTIAAGKDPYKSIGPTNDLGKYQVSPDTLKDWSKAWVGKAMSPAEFLANPDAQEKFFNEFIKVKDSYKLSNEDAAILWHRGFGVLGTGKNKEIKEKELKQYLDKIRNQEKSQSYLQSFKQGTST